MQHEGEKGDALLVYRNSKIENKEVFVQYTKVLLEPVQLYAGPGSTLPEAPEEQRETIAKAFYAQLYDKLSQDYEMVTQRGPNTFHVHAAIVDAEKSGGWTEGISYIPMPVGVPGVKMALMQLKDKSTGKPAFVGEVTIEGKYTDAQTEEVLAAIIDRRVGVRHPIYGLLREEDIRYVARRGRGLSLLGREAAISILSAAWRDRLRGTHGIRSHHKVGQDGMCWWYRKYVPGDADRHSLGAVVLYQESIGRQSGS